MTIEMQDFGFSQALAIYVQATGKTMVESMNRAAGQVAYRSIKTTKRAADMWPIMRQDRPPRFTKKGKKGKRFKRDLASGPSTPKQKRFYFALAAKRGVTKGGGRMTKAANAIWGKRRSGKGYTAASWVPAMRELGQSDKIPPKLRDFRGKGYARFGGAEPATEKVHQAKITNAAPASELIGFEPMERAAFAVIADMHDYAISQMQKKGKEISGP